MVNILVIFDAITRRKNSFLIGFVLLTDPTIFGRHEGDKIDSIEARNKADRPKDTSRMREMLKVGN